MVVLLILLRPLSHFSTAITPRSSSSSAVCCASVCESGWVGGMCVYCVCVCDVCDVCVCVCVCACVCVYRVCRMLCIHIHMPIHANTHTHTHTHTHTRGLHQIYTQQPCHLDALQRVRARSRGQHVFSNSLFFQILLYTHQT